MLANQNLVRSFVFFNFCGRRRRRRPQKLKNKIRRSDPVAPALAPNSASKLAPKSAETEWIANISDSQHYGYVINTVHSAISNPPAAASVFAVWHNGAKPQHNAMDSGGSQRRPQFPARLPCFRSGTTDPSETPK